MSLSILILTHNRPELFQRCIQSVLDVVPDDVEIIVNNDSNDITEVRPDRVSYFYESYDNLSSVYQSLLYKSTKEYVYFLEDDDYLRPSFFDVVLPLNNEYDVISGNYLPTHNHTEVVLRSHIVGKYYDKKQFVESLDFHLLQLSKFVFKRSTIIDYPFKNDNNVYNDADLLLHAVTNSSSFICVPNVFFYQTVDGGDNISFEQFTDDVCSSEDFYEQYKELWK